MAFLANRSSHPNKINTQRYSDRAKLRRKGINQTERGEGVERERERLQLRVQAPPMKSPVDCCFKFIGLHCFEALPVKQHVASDKFHKRCQVTFKRGGKNPTLQEFSSVPLIDNRPIMNAEEADGKWCIRLNWGLGKESNNCHQFHGVKKCDEVTDGRLKRVKALQFNMNCVRLRLNE